MTMQEPVMRGHVAYDLHAAGKPSGKLGKASQRRPRSASLAAWNSPYQISAGSRRSFSIAASNSLLMIHIFTLLLWRPATAVRVLNGASDGISRGDASSLCPPDSTCASYGSSSTATSQKSRNENGDFALHSGVLLFPESLPAAPWRMYFKRSASRNTFSKSEIPTAAPPRPHTVAQSQKLSEAVHLLDVESGGGSFLAAKGKQAGRLDNSDFGQPREEQWLCRISGLLGACDSAVHEGRGPGWYCSTIACCGFSCPDQGCGKWCHHKNVGPCSWKHGPYDGPQCSCQYKGYLCSSNASCHTVDVDRGGAYCTCGQRFLGDGKTCNKNPCHPNPCSPGSCSARGNQYVCDCPATHEVQGSDVQSCVKKVACVADPCGSVDIVETCLDFQTGYECICKDGYISENGSCQKKKRCEGDPCGPPIAVKDCISMSIGHKCKCQRGYSLQRDAEGVEYCAKDYCADKPCGSSELVKSCVSIGGDRKDSDIDTALRYSCVCSDVAELEVDIETHKERCVRIDQCLRDPCGPPEAVSQCFVQGLSYGCTCEEGYTVVRTGENGGRRCVSGDPCSSKPCGPEEFVDKCAMKGQTYTCQCSDKGFLSLEADGMQVCRSKELCEENCGPSIGLKSCTPNDSGYDCMCKPRFVMTFTEEKRSCEARDPCAVAPCGTAEAVAECRPAGHGYSCLCNPGYELRYRPDETQLCAEPQSCEGDPCGAVDTVQQCIPGKYTYSCTCQEPYLVREFHGRKRCALPVSEEDGETKPGIEVQEKEEWESQPVALVAGVAVGGLLLVGAAYVGNKYAQRHGEQQQLDSWEEAEVSPDGHLAEALGDPTGDIGRISSEQRPTEDTMVAPSPSAWG